MWSEFPRLIFAESERVAKAASECLGALGAAIYHSQGATIPQRGKPDAKRPQRGGRKPGPGSGPSQRPGMQNGPTQLHAAILLEWATGILNGESPLPKRAVMSGTQYTLVMQALQHFVQCCPAELRSSAAFKVMKTIQALLDAPSTKSGHLLSYLEVLLDVAPHAHPTDTGMLLPDMIDVFLGWAVDPSSTQPCRCGPGSTICAGQMFKIRLCNCVVACAGHSCTR